LLHYLAHAVLLLGTLYALSNLSVGAWFLLPMAFVATFLFMWFSKMISLNNWRSFVKKQ
jgi:hypothetical protein